MPPALTNIGLFGLSEHGPSGEAQIAYPIAYLKKK
jgi:hypothetical protein